MKPSDCAAKFAKLSGPVSPHATVAMTTAAATPMIHQSKRARSSTGSGATASSCSRRWPMTSASSIIAASSRVAVSG